MAEKAQSSEETRELHTTVPEELTSASQSLEHVEQERRRSSEVFEQRTRELTRAVATLRATLESTADAILVTDEKDKVTEFNEIFVEMWRVPPEVVQGGTLHELRGRMSRNFEDPRSFLARVEEIAAGISESFDILEFKDGLIIERYSKILTVQAEKLGRVWNYREVTERYSAEITSRRLAAIVASSDDAIIGKNLEGIISSWNHGAERIFGYTAEEMIGTSIMRLIPPNRQEEEGEILSRIRLGERFDHFETVRLAKDGRELNVAITVSPIKDSAGRVVGASKVARDISERKKAEERQRQLLTQAATANANWS
jgi:PAS domain S-box-containing protein